MTQEDKELLLKDLSARVPFKVKLYIESLVNPIIHDKGIRTLATVLPTRGAIEYDIQGSNQGIIVELVKPYLRPMSSMTKEEFNHYKCLNDALDENYEVHIDNAYPAFDWLNAHHFDYRGLIEKGLALKAPEGMYELNKK